MKLVYQNPKADLIQVSDIITASGNNNIYGCQGGLNSNVSGS